MSDAAPNHQSMSPAAKLLLAAAIIAAIFFRIYALDRLPGINGDEAWYGVQVQRWVAGETVDWRTPTGNLQGPLQFGWLAVLQSLFPPSFLLLRIPSLISSLVAMALAYAIGRRFFDRTTGVAALLLMAVLPANIVYARFGWDPSHSGLVVLAALYAALAQRPYLAALAFAFALLIHPTNLFAAPFLLLAYLGLQMEQGGRRAWSGAALFAGLLVLAVVILTATISGVHASRSLGGIVARLASPGEWLLFPLLFVRLLSGDTVLAYATGGGWGAAPPLADGLVAMILAGLLVAGFVRMRTTGFDRAAGLVAGWLASILAFFVLAGSAAIQPHYERYAFVLVAPTAMALAVLIGKSLPDERRGRQAMLLMPAMALAVLAALWAGYFQSLEAGRSGQHRAFWTGPVEPKKAAFDLIAADAGPEDGLIIAEDWWLKWPIAYLAEHGSLRVVEEADPHPTRASGDCYWVAYQGGALDRRLEEGNAVPRWTVRTVGPGHSLRIWQEPRASLNGPICNP